MYTFQNKAMYSVRNPNETDQKGHTRIIVFARHTTKRVGGITTFN